MCAINAFIFHFFLEWLKFFLKKIIIQRMMPFGVQIVVQLNQNLNQIRKKPCLFLVYLSTSTGERKLITCSNLAFSHPISKKTKQNEIKFNSCVVKQYQSCALFSPKSPMGHCVSVYVLFHLLHDR